MNNISSVRIGAILLLSFVSVMGITPAFAIHAVGEEEATADEFSFRNL